MVLLVPKVYCGIKEKGRFEGERAERERIAAGITDPETRRIVMNVHSDGERPPR